MSFYYSRKTCIFPNGLNHDSNKKTPYIFPFYVSVKETLVLSFDDVVFSKGGFLDYWNVILLESKNLYFSKYLSSLLFCKRDLVFEFVSSKRGFLDYKNVILPE